MTRLALLALLVLACQERSAVQNPPPSPPPPPPPHGVDTIPIAGHALYVPAGFTVNLFAQQIPGRATSRRRLRRPAGRGTDRSASRRGRGRRRRVGGLGAGGPRPAVRARVPRRHSVLRGTARREAARPRRGGTGYPGAERPGRRATHHPNPGVRPRQPPVPVRRVHVRRV